MRECMLLIVESERACHCTAALACEIAQPAVPHMEGIYITTTLGYCRRC